MIRKRKRLYSKFKISKKPSDFENYKHIRNKTIAEIRKSKKSEVDKLAAKLSNNDIGPKDWWKTLKHFIKPEQSTSIPPLLNDDTILTDETEKASLLNDFFVGQTVLDESRASLPSDLPIPDNNLNTISTSPFEVESILKSLPLGKATGPDAINNRILRELATPLSSPLSDLFNFSLINGKVPLMWKEANVTPIFKKDDPSIASSWKYIKAGVPQGSILGPLLFLIYINDIVDEIHSCIRLFADDTSLYIIVDNPLQAAATLNEDLEKLHSWASKWLVTFNPSKSEAITFTRKRIRPLHPPLYMNHQAINEVSSHKHLGLILSNDCNWHEHIEYIKTKAWFRINIMRRLKFKLDRKSLEIIYMSFIRPLLEYASVVWDNCAEYESEELEKIQNEAARIVTGATKLVSLEALYIDTGWESLETRREKHLFNSIK